MPDVDPDLLAEFLNEAHDHLAVLESELLLMEKQLAATPHESLNRIFRSVHSIKGTAGFLGFQNIVTLSHVMETLFDRFRKGSASPTPDAVSLLFDAADDLVKMVNDLPSEPSYNVAPRVAAIEALLQSPDATPSTPKSPKKNKARSKTPAPPTADQPPTPQPPTPITSSPLPANLPLHYTIHIDDLEAFERLLDLTPVRLFRTLEAVGYVADSHLQLPGPFSPQSLRKALPLTISFYSDKSPAQLEAATQIPEFYFSPSDPSSPLIPLEKKTASAEPSTSTSAEKTPTPTSPEPTPPSTPSSTPPLTPDDNLNLDELFHPSPEPSQTPTSEPTPEDIPSTPQPPNPNSPAEGSPAAPPRPQPPPTPSSPSPAQPPSTAAAAAAAAADTVRVPSRKLDHLVNLVGEMVILHAQLASTSRSLAAKHPELQSTIEGLERLGAELRDTVLNIRMMPVGSTFQKYHRLVRDLARELGKEAELVIEGGETELDKTVLDQLGDPLTHILRNSLDHGLESPDQREAAGKPRRGTIRLAAEHRGDRVAISISDDGRGLNTERIRSKAIERGLIPPDARLPDQDIWQLIFEPGFSTAQQVTGISGRGVGMDVVKKKIQLLGGEVHLQSVPGCGTTITLSLPLTLAIIDGLMVEVDGDRLIIPLSIVAETIELSRTDRLRHNARNVVDLRGHPIPYLRLRNLFGYPDGNAPIEPVVIVEQQGHRIGLVVDRVIGNHQTVLKSLGRLCKNVTYFSGATILGDGTVALVLDVPGILRAHRASIDPSSTLEV